MTPTIDVAPAVWSSWRETWEQAGASSGLPLLFVSPAGSRAEADALQSALLEVGEAFERLPPHEDLEG
jgi:hypothetical protein